MPSGEPVVTYSDRALSGYSLKYEEIRAITLYKGAGTIIGIRTIGNYFMLVHRTWQLNAAGGMPTQIGIKTGAGYSYS